MKSNLFHTIYIHDSVQITSTSYTHAHTKFNMQFNPNSNTSEYRNSHDAMPERRAQKKNHTVNDRTAAVPSLPACRRRCCKRNN